MPGGFDSIGLLCGIAMLVVPIWLVAYTLGTKRGRANLWRRFRNLAKLAGCMFLPIVMLVCLFLFLAGEALGR